MSEVKKKSFSELYPNHRMEYRNKVISQMIPAIGWWKLIVNSEGDNWIRPIAFFAYVKYEEREIWDGGFTSWQEQSIVMAQGGGEDFFMDYLFCMVSGNIEIIFYDPDFRLSHNDQGAGEVFIKEYSKIANERF